MEHPNVKAGWGVLGPEPQYPIESVDNALKILLLLRDQNDLRQRDVADYLGVASSTAHRLLAMLQYRGFLRRDPGNKTYRPGSRLTTLSYSVLAGFDIRELLRPVLEELHQTLQETVHLGSLEGTNVRFLDAIESPHAVRVASRMGQSKPAAATATGKALLAEVPSDELRRLYPNTEITGAKAVKSRLDLERELVVVRERGYATSEEDNEDGVSSVALTIPTNGSVSRLALNVSLPVSRMLESDLERITFHMRKIAEKGSELLS
ncbi:IclR family transcriptional regulator [Nesterenkonia sphaerica]|uniref:IclR family transcriptional regulator n=1 Tax=Nesterenkonia sphaerica TaxID=1804988 RepID=A0A5R8ZXH2_9MICC|nr:IclR family transcriptional regulator [Nesterenkonia sphaerica]TLP70565.1 IclR family transcriptional regulator [Nesterenkonia sphaerica]